MGYLTAGERGKMERVDLSVNRPDPDSDGDGLPDWWEDLYFSGLADPNADPDGDGMSNLSEYRAGTDPTDPNSRFAFIHVERLATGETRVEWASVPGRSYTVLRSPVLTNDRSHFAILQAGIAATSSVSTFIDTTAAGPGPFFYLLRLE